MPSVRTAVASCIRPGAHRVGPQRAPPVVGHDGGLHGVLLLLVRGERPSAASVHTGSAHLHLDCVQLQFNIFGPGVGENVPQRAQTHPWTVRGRVSALGQQGADLTNGTGEVERSVPNSSPRTVCGRSWRRWIRWPASGQRRRGGDGRLL